ncbi:MAG: hypothetical protein PVG82_00830 [Chromatiales bacterium]|jgi:hypothetical protein
MEELGRFVYVLDILSVLSIFVIGSAALGLIVLYVIDRRQTDQAIRHNYPVIGRLRYLFEHLGKFFRQYFFAMDRDELPFNRACLRRARAARATTLSCPCRDRQWLLPDTGRGLSDRAWRSDRHRAQSEMNHPTRPRQDQEPGGTVV